MWRKSTFASKRAHELTRQANSVFGGDPDATYSTFKKSVPDTDFVQYDDVRKLWRVGTLSPDSVEHVLQ